MDATESLLLARAQFGLNFAFHILFSTLTIALAWFLVYFGVRTACFAARPGRGCTAESGQGAKN